MSLKSKIIAVTPMMCVFVFLLLGFVWQLWHPGWIVFFLIPIMPYLVGKRKLRFTIPLIITIAYLILGFGWSLWHPGWIIFLLVPVFSILFSKSKITTYFKKKDDYIDVE